MKKTIALQNDIRRDRTPAVTKATLVLLFLLGIALIIVGIMAMGQYDASGFSSEGAFGAVYSLQGHVSGAWEKKMGPQLNAMPQDTRAKTDAAALEMLQSAWEKQKKDGADEAQALLDGTAEAEKSALTYKLLYITYLVSGPKVSTAIKKELAAVREDRLATLREELLLCVADETAPIPPEGSKALDGLTGQDRHAMAMQLWFLSGDSAAATDAVNTLKKTVRDKGAQLTAYSMITQGKISWLWQTVLSNSRTVILLGIALALDAILLTLLMMTDKTWIIDFKWILILLIIDFLLVFQMLPVVYMTIRVFFPEGSFTLDIVRRLYTYSLNVEALKNTLIAAFATMVLGTLLAFPLAWLVGRTNLYGKKFFRALFVLTYMVPP